jgi:UTP:GlnB (protein PII) uridylyltransferase
MEVDKLDEQMYLLKISCQNGPGVLVQLTQALESLDLDVLNTYHTSFKESLLNTFIVEVLDFTFSSSFSCQFFPNM